MSKSDLSASDFKSSVVDASFELLNVDEESGDIKNRLSHSLHKSSMASSFRPPESEFSSSILGESRHYYNPSRIIFDRQLAEHPLETIEKYERDISSQLGQEKSFEEKFVLSNFNALNEGQYSSVKYSEEHNLTNHCFPDHSGSLPVHNGEKWGIPRCIAVNAKSRHIAIGTSQAIVMLFSYDLTSLQKLGTGKEIPYGEVTAIDIASRDDALIAGYTSGNIVLWSTAKNERLKTIRPPDKSPILSLKFIRETKQYFLTSTSSGAVFQYKIDTFFMKLDYEKTEININDTIQKTLKAYGENAAQEIPDGFFDIQMLPKDFTRNHFLTRFTVAGLASMKRVVVVTLEPSFAIVYVAERPDGIPDYVIPCFGWGSGPVPGPEQKNHPLLALSWGKDLFLYQMESTDNGEEQGLKKIGYFQSKTNIFHIEWISHGYFMIYDQTKELRILFTSNFRPTSHLNSNAQFDSSKTVIDRQTVNFEARGQLFQDKSRVDANSRPVFYYSNTMKGLSSARRIFIMGEHEMIIAKHYEWDEFLTELTKKGEWIIIFLLCISFYQGNNTKFAGLPQNRIERQKMLQPVFKNLVQTYIEANSKVRDDAKATTLIETVIDFLVSVKSFKYLFLEAKLLFEKQRRNDLFLHCLEPFILKNRITEIPDVILKDVIKFFLRQGKLDVVQFLIIHLSPEHMNLDHVITICMENNLLTALMFLCPQKNDMIQGPDFITPLAKALSTYQRSLKNEQANAKDNGIRFLWFLHMILNGRKFPSGVIPENVWEKVIQEVVVLLFEEMTIDLTLKAELYVAFDIFRLFFQPTIASVIEAFTLDVFRPIPKNHSIIEKNEKGEKSEKGEVALTVVQRTIEKFREAAGPGAGNGVQGEMLALIYHCSKKDLSADNENCLFYLLADLSVFYKYSIPAEIIDECIFYIFKNPRNLPPWEKEKKKKNLEESREDEDEIEMFLEERSEIVLELIKKIRTKLSEYQIDRFTWLARQENFYQVEVYLLEMKREYLKCFEIYLAQKKDVKRQQVFKWLDQLIPTLKKKQTADFNTVKDIILAKLKDLVQINSEKTRKIIVGLDKSLEISAIELLESIPDLQLDYLQKILAKRNDGAIIPDRLLILHISLLCQNSPSKVLPEVQAYDYPLEECLKICREHQVKDALAFFLEKNGNVFEALENYLEVFTELAVLKYNEVKDGKPFGPTETGLLKDKFNCVRELCLNACDQEDTNYEAYWFHFLDRMLEFYDKNISNDQDESNIISIQIKTFLNKFKDTYSSLVSQLFDDLSKYISVENFIIRLQSYKHLNLNELKTSLLEILRTYHHESNVYDSATALLRGDITENTADVYNTASAGIKNDLLQLDGDKIKGFMMFKCGHIFQKSLLTARVCSICMNLEEAKAGSVIQRVLRNKIGGPQRTQRPNANAPKADEKEEKKEAADSEQKESEESAQSPAIKPNPRNLKKAKNIKNLERFDDSVIQKARNLEEFSIY